MAHLGKCTVCINKGQVVYKESIVWNWKVSHLSPPFPSTSAKNKSSYNVDAPNYLPFGIHHILQSLTISNSLNLESIWGQRHIIFILLSCCLWGMILELGSDFVRARIVTYYNPPPPRILLNICCAGIDSPSRDPEKRVVLGHCCHSSISWKYLRRRVSRWGARSRFIWWESPLNTYVSTPC